MSTDPYESYLQKKMRQQHFVVHELTALLQQQQRKNAKLSQQLHKELPILRRKQNQNKILIKQLNEKIKVLQMQLDAAKNPVKKAGIDRANIAKRGSIQEDGIDRKEIFKQFINDNYPKYKDVVRKTLAFILHIQKHAAKSPKQRIDTYYEIMGGWMRKFFALIFNKSTTTNSQKNQSIAQKMVTKWKSSDGRMKELMVQRNQYKAKLDEQIEKVQKYQANQVRFTANKKAMQAKIFAYQISLQLKGAQFVAHLKKLMANPADVDPNQKVRIEQIIQTMSLLANTKNSTNNNQTKQIQSLKNLQNNNSSIKIGTNTDKIQNQSTIKQAKQRGKSSIKLRKNPPVIKKNIFGYYQTPQFQNNQPNLSLTKHPYLSKCIQTIPQDLSLLTTKPIILLTVIDGNIKPQRNRHCINFYVKICYNLENKLEILTKVCLNCLQPVWNQGFLINGYNFPFFGVDLMNQSKGLKNYSIGSGRIQVAKSQLPKQVSIKNDGEFQGKVRLMISYPKGRIYQFTISSIKLSYPINFPMPKDTLTLKFPLNPQFSTIFQIGQKIKYFDDDNYNKYNNKMLILEGYDGSIMGSFQYIKNKGSVSLSALQDQGEKQVEIMVGKDWKVVISGVLLLIVSQEDQPQAIVRDQNEKEYEKYFSLIAQYPVAKVEYNGFVLPEHIKMPLVFKFDEKVNFMNIYKQIKDDQQAKQTRKLKKGRRTSKIVQKQLQSIQITPIVIPNTNIICPIHTKIGQPTKKLLQAPKIIYQIKIQVIEGEFPVTLTTPQVYFQKLLAQIVLQCNDKQFYITSSQLIQNFYTVMSRTFRTTGYIKFKIGYITHKNILTQTQLEPQPQPPIIIPPIPPTIPQKQLQPINTNQHYCTLQLSTIYFDQYSSTADYSIQFIFGNCNRTTKKTGNKCQIKEYFILPIKKQIMMKVMQYTLTGDKCIYEGGFVVKDRDLKLMCKFVNFGEKMNNYIYFSNITNITDIYSIKVNKIQAQLTQNTDWIGKMDPYIKFTALSRLLYQTQKLQQVQDIKNITFNNDQFVALLPINFINVSVYDDDLVGKDDFIGECTINVPEQGVVDCVEGVLKKGKELNENCGSVKLKGEFGKLVGASQYRVKQCQMKLPIKVYKITVYGLEIDQKQFSNSDQGYLTYQIINKNNFKNNLTVKSLKHTRSDNEYTNNPNKNVHVDFCIWIKQQMTNNDDIVIQLWKKVGNIFTKKQHNYAYTKISSQLISQTQSISILSSPIILKSTNTNIGLLHYIIQPIQQSRSIIIQTTASQQIYQNLIFISDSGDYVKIYADVYVQKEQEQDSNNQNNSQILMYDQNWYVVTQEEYQMCQMVDRVKKREKYLGICDRESKYMVSNMQSINMNMSSILTIHPRSQSLNSKHLNNPKCVLLAHRMQYTRPYSPVSLPQSLTLQLQYQQYKYSKLNHMVIKSTSTNKPIIPSYSNFNLVLCVKWQKYQLRMAVKSEENYGNLWVVQKMLPIYIGVPVNVELLQVRVRDKNKKGNMQEEEVQVVFKEQFKIVSHSLSINNNNNKRTQIQNQPYQSATILPQTAKISSSFSYRSSTIIFSCQFTILPYNLSCSLLYIPEFYIQLPLINTIYNSQFQAQNLTKQNKNNKIEYQLQLQITAVNKNSNSEIVGGILVYPINNHIDNNDVLIQGRIIRVRNIGVVDAGYLAHCWFADNYNKYDQHLAHYKLHNVNVSMQIIHKSINNEQSYNINYIKQIQQLTSLKFPSQSSTESQSSTQLPIPIYSSPSKYNTAQLSTISYTQHYLHIPYLQSSLSLLQQLQRPYIVNRCLITLHQIKLDIGDDIDNYNIQNTSMSIIFRNQKTNTKTIFNMVCMDIDKKIYQLQPNIMGYHLLIDQPESSIYIVQCVVTKQKGVIDKIVNIDNHVCIGQASTTFDNWQLSSVNTLKLQLKSNKNNSSIGHILVKYQCQPSKQLQNNKKNNNNNNGLNTGRYQQYVIDGVITQSNSKNSCLRLQCKIDDDDQSNMSVSQVADRVYYLNQQQDSNNNSAVYGISQPIYLSKYNNNNNNNIMNNNMNNIMNNNMNNIMNNNMNNIMNNSEYPSNHIITVYNNKYNNTLGAINTTHLLSQLQWQQQINQAILQGTANIKNKTTINKLGYARWYMPIFINSIPTAILTGYRFNVDLLNVLVQKVSDQIPIVIQQQQQKIDDKSKDEQKQQIRLPSQLQISQKISTTILQLSLSNFTSQLQKLDKIYITLHTSLRTIRNKRQYKPPVSSSSALNNNNVDNNTNTNSTNNSNKIYILHKQIFSTSLTINICDRKQKILYTGIIQAKQVGEIGYIVFQQGQKYSQNQNEKGVICGMCLYTLKVAELQHPHSRYSPYQPYPYQYQQSQYPQSQTQSSISNLSQLPIFLQLSSITLQSYRNTQLLTKMTPYLTISNTYLSSTAIGQSDLFYSLNLLIPMQKFNRNTICNTTRIQITVSDKDMFFDDYIGTAYIQIQGFDIQRQIMEDIQQKLNKKQHTVLKLQQMNHNWYDVLDHGQLVGRIKVQYRYLLSLPVIMLYTTISIQNNKLQGYKQQLIIHADRHLQQIKNNIMKNRYGNKDAVKSIEDINVNVVCARVGQGNIGEFGESRVLVDVGDEKEKVKGNNNIVKVNNVQISNIDKSVANMLIQNKDKQFKLYFTTSLENTRSLSKITPHYKWQTPHNTLLPLSNNSSQQNTLTIPSLLPYLPIISNNPLLHYISSLTIFLNKSKIQSTQNLLISVMTQYGSIQLKDGVNCGVEIKGDGHRGVIVKVNIWSNVVLVWRFGKYGQCAVLTQQQIMVIIQDTTHGQLYNCHMSASKPNMKIHTPPSSTLSYNTTATPTHYLLQSKIHRSSKHHPCITSYSNSSQFGVLYAGVQIVNCLKEKSIQEMEKCFKVVNNNSDKIDKNNSDFNEKDRQAVADMREICDSSIIKTDNIAGKYIKLTISKANMLKDIQIFSKMDPYCIVHSYVSFSNPKQLIIPPKQSSLCRTKTAQNKGKYPQWNQQFYIPLPIQQKMLWQFVIMDQEVTKDRLVAVALFDIIQTVNSMCKRRVQRENVIVKLVQNIDKGVYAGQLFIQITVPIDTHIMFTSISSLSQSAPLPNIFYQQLPITQSPNTPFTPFTTPLPSQQTFQLNPFQQLPIFKNTAYIRVILYYQSKQKYVTKCISVQELDQMVDRIDGRVRIVQMGIQLCYVIIENNGDIEGNDDRLWNKLWDTGYRNVIDQKQKLRKIKEQRLVIKKKQQQANNAFQFILQDNNNNNKESGAFILQQQPTKKQIKIDSQNPMFILDTPAQQKQSVFILSQQKLQSKMSKQQPKQQNKTKTSMKEQQKQKQKQINGNNIQPARSTNLTKFRFNKR